MNKHWMNKRVTVTGGAGFLGQHLVKRLERQGAQVFVPRRRDYDLTSLDACLRCLLEHPADGVALIRLNRPEARNALNMEVRRQLAQHVAAATDDPAVRVIIFTGGDKVFAAGADIKEMAGVSPQPATSR